MEMYFQSYFKRHSNGLVRGFSLYKHVYITNSQYYYTYKVLFLYK